MTDDSTPDDDIVDSLMGRTERGTHRGADAVFDAARSRRPAVGQVWMAAAAALLIVVGGVVLVRTTRSDDASVTVGGTSPESTTDAATTSDPTVPGATAPEATATSDPSIATSPVATAPTDTIEGAPATTPGTIIEGSQTATTPPVTAPPVSTTDTTPQSTSAPTTPSTPAEPSSTTTLAPDAVQLDPALLFVSGAIVADWNRLADGLVVATIEPRADTGTALWRTPGTVPFDGSRLVVEFSATAGNQTHGSSVWPEIVLSPASAPTERRQDALFATDVFSGEWTLGCRLESARTPVCALMNDSELGVGDGGRDWQASFFETAGSDSFGGEPSGERADAWRTCPATAPSEPFAFDDCLDRFRLELTSTSLTLFVNDVRYFEQTGLPPLPDELLTSSYAYRAVSQSRSDLETLTVYWRE